MMKKILFVFVLFSVFVGLMATSEIALTWDSSVVTIDGKKWVVYTATKDDTVLAASTAAYTSKLPFTLPLDTESYLWVNPEAATLDDSSTAIYMYGGYSASFEVTVSGQTATVTDGCILNGGTAIETDVKASCAIIEFDPNREIALTANLAYKLPKIPYVAFTVIPTTSFSVISGDVIFFKVFIPPKK